MQATPVRLFNALLWPLTIWASLTHLEEHPADDYVERTTPIAASALAFLVGLVALIVFANPGVMHVVGSADGEELVGRMRRNWGSIVSVLYFFVPVMYLVGLWLYTARDERFPR